MHQPSTYVQARGPIESNILLVGESPTLKDLSFRDPIAGPPGNNLQECLQVAGLDKSQCRRTLVIKDLDNPYTKYINIDARKGKILNTTPIWDHYLEILTEELLQGKHNIVVAMGNLALLALCDRWGINKWRGSILESTLVEGQKVIPLIHPNVYTKDKLYSNPDAYLNKYLIINDLKKVAKEQEFPEIKLTPLQLHIRPDYTQTMAFLTNCYEKGLEGTIIDYDIETYNNELGSISFTFGDNSSLCIPFVYEKGDYFNPDEELQVLQKIALILECPNIMKRGQNIIFDGHYLLRKYGIRCQSLCHDTMVAQQMIWPELPKGLDFITSIWTDIPYYKQDGKIWLQGTGSFERGWQYNCLDSIATNIAHSHQLKKITKMGNLSTYERQCALIEPLVYMMESGIKVDMEGMRKETLNMGDQLAQLKEEFTSIAGDINPLSPEQLCSYFYVKKQLPPYTNDGKLTTDETALKRIARKGHKEAALVLEIRKLTKRISTYTDAKKIDSDGRLRCSYNPVGTKFSRISSSENLFGTGMNMQNIPHDLRTYLIADPGYIIYSLDGSQFENRIVAYVGNIPQMIAAFEQGIDVHNMTASLTWSIIHGKPLPIDEVNSEQRQELGKRPNHAFNYGYGHKSYALKYMLPESTALQIYKAYHKAYPGIEHGYWAYVRQCLAESRTLTNLMNRVTTFLGNWNPQLLYAAYSCIPQGTCGDVINERGINHVYYDSYYKPVRLMAQIHDEIVMQVPLDIPISEHAKILIRIKESMEQPLRFRDKEFIIPVDLNVNDNMNKSMGVELKRKKFSTDPKVLAQTLSEAINKIQERNNDSTNKSH